MTVHRTSVRLRVEALEPRTTPTTLPAGFTESLVASGLHAPSAMAFAPDGRLFVLEQTGSVRVVKNGSLLATPFLTLGVDSSGERGLLGIAFDPNFAADHFVYLYHTVPGTPAHNRVSRFTANGDSVVPGSEVVIADLDPLSGATNHNGGGMHFGPDGKLYVGVGENANGANAQTLTNRLGKLLRLNPDGSIPTDNPFYTTAAGANRSIWAYGLRNPFTFSFQAGTGRLFINDVGANTWEEVNAGAAGANYGWPQTEGPTTAAGVRGPLYAYTHGGGAFQGGAIAGAAFYNPPKPTFPSGFVGQYFFAHFVSSWIPRVDSPTGAVTAFASGLTTNGPVDLTTGTDGGLYYLARGSGSATGVVYRIQYPTVSLPPKVFAAGADAGGTPVVKLFNSVTGAPV